MRLVLAALLVVSAHAPVHADIYSISRPDGTTCFTDTPGTKDAKLYLKESPARRQQPAGATGTGSSKDTLREFMLSDKQDINGITGGTTLFKAPVTGVVTSKYGMRRDPFNGEWTHHNGLDIAVKRGTVVRAAYAGTVAFAGWMGGYGKAVVLAHDSGYFSLYGHNDSLLVAEGAQVDAGAAVARAGSTGRSTGPHLHFEVRRRLAPDEQGGTATARLSAPLKESEIKIRKAIQPDGSILFTYDVGSSGTMTTKVSSTSR